MEDPILDTLNPSQRAAVTDPNPYVLVLAGAGSGKTRVIVHRIAWKLQQEQVSPYSILAVTFTNKAAGEMRRRLNAMLSHQLDLKWIGTFHSLAHQLLRLHSEAAGLPQNFQILDAEDQLRLIRRLCKSLDINDKELDPKTAMYFINGSKDQGWRYKDVPWSEDYLFRLKHMVYEAYENACDKSGLVDFSELLLRSYQLLQQHPDILERYQKQFSNIFVDEFQDTNTLQYKWIRLLAGAKLPITVVGDDDQSIYGWRGAKIENIHRFERDFSQVSVIRLEQNYRSTGTILNAANALIAHNTARMGKTLWTESGDGDPITVYESFDEYDEAHYITAKLQAVLESGRPLDDCAVLYRSNAQSRIIEETLVKQGVPYKIHGGLRFFERAEIKDALAYLRLLIHPHDDAAFERVVNVPKRGIGERSIMLVRQRAAADYCSLWQATHKVLEDGVITGPAKKGLAHFVALISNLTDKSKEDIKTLSEVAKQAVVQSGLLGMYEQASTEKEKNKAENLEELVNACAQYKNNDNEDVHPLTVLSEFLAQVSLDSGEAQHDAAEPMVSLMTMHAAKGLEFPIVFMCGMEEGLFPSGRSQGEPEKLEEERRLCYVGITRAMEKLFLTYAEKRNFRGYAEQRRPSRFIGEIPGIYLEEVRRHFSVSSGYSGNRRGSSMKQSMVQDAPYRLGQHVMHPKFGEGIVLQIEGSGETLKIQIQFSVGTKWLMLSHAKLSPVN